MPRLIPSLALLGAITLLLAPARSTAQSPSSSGGRIPEERVERLPDPLGDGPPPAPRRIEEEPTIPKSAPSLGNHTASGGTSTQPAASNPPAAPPVVSPPARSKVLGKYVCQAFEAGQLINQGEFHLLANGTYRDVWNRRNGRWMYQPSTGVFRFTGILQNGARAVYTFDKYRPERTKGMIEFTWEPDLKRWCYHD